ncbi:hypothetical protein Tco_1268839 [Tanacetum coccineum]
MMADNCTMAELLQAPTEGYEDAIVVPAITADNFELKHSLLTLVQNKQFFGHDKEDPHAHIRYFNEITSTMKFPNVPITFNDLVSECTHHGFSKLHQLDTFYNALNSNDQDSLNSAAGGNFLDKMPRECLKIIESKSKVRQSRSKAIVSKVSTSSSTLAFSSDVVELKTMVRTLILDKKNQTPAPVKAVEQSCVTCGGGHSYQNCPATDGNIYRDNIQEYVSQAAAANFNQGNTGARPPMVANQIRPPGITTRSGVTYQGPTIPPTTSSPKVMNHNTEVTNDTMLPTNNGSIEDVQPPVVQVQSRNPISKPVVSPVSAPMPNQRTSIPFPSRRNNERR